LISTASASPLLSPPATWISAAVVSSAAADADRLELLDMVLDRGLVAAGPAGDHELSRPEIDSLTGRLATD
jgi:hypothetical protein